MTDRNIKNKANNSLLLTAINLNIFAECGESVKLLAKYCDLEAKTLIEYTSIYY